MLPRTLVLATCLLAAATTAQVPFPNGTISPPLSGTVDFGRDVAVSGSRVMIASATRLAIYDTATQSFEATNVLAPIPAIQEIVSFGIDGDLAAVTFRSGGGGGLHSVYAIEFNGSGWSLGENLQGLTYPVWCDVHDGLVFTVAQGTSTPFVQARDPDLDELAGVATALVPELGTIRNVAVGPCGPTGGTTVVIAHESVGAGTRGVLALRLANALSSPTFVNETELIGGVPASWNWGESLDVAPNWIAVGVPDAPLDLGGASPIGRVLYFRNEAGSIFNYPFESGSWGEQVGDRLGAAVAINDEVVLHNETLSDVQPGSAAIVVRRRPSVSSNEWVDVGERHHTQKAFSALSPTFAASLAISAPDPVTGVSLFAAGEPGFGGGTGRVVWRKIAGNSPITIGPLAVAGAGGTPDYEVLGATYDDALLRFELSDAPASSLATLVIGTTQLFAPFKGGVLGPSPDIVVPLTTKPDGTLVLPAQWPSFSGIPFFVNTQWWIVDAGGPQGFSATDMITLQYQ